MALYFILFSKDTFNCQGKKIMVFPFTKKKKKKRKNDLSSGLLWVMNKSLWYDYRKYF